MKIQNDTVYTEENIKRLHAHSLYRRRGILTLCFLAPFLVTAGVIWLNLQGAADFMMWFALVLVWVVALAMIFLLLILPSLQRSGHRALNAKLTYVFTDREIRIHGTLDGSSEDGNLSYDKFHHIVETRSSYFLYPNARQAYIVDKSGFQGDGEEEVFRFLLSTFPKKKFRHTKR